MDQLSPVRSRTTIAATRSRPVAASNHLARRGAIIRAAKWALPGVALILLSSVALWPELNRLTSRERAIAKHLTETDGVRMQSPHYRGVDERGRPYTITADSALQPNPQRVDLVKPEGDVVSDRGDWISVRSHDGVYIQHAGQLDLSNEVMLYRSDGMILRTDSAAVEIKAGAVANNALTHVEGPFGTIDAMGFTMLDRGAILQFTGPAHMVINQSQ